MISGYLHLTGIGFPFANFPVKYFLQEIQILGRTSADLQLFLFKNHKDKLQELQWRYFTKSLSQTRFSLNFLSQNSPQPHLYVHGNDFSWQPDVYNAWQQKSAWGSLAGEAKVHISDSVQVLWDTRDKYEHQDNLVFSVIKAINFQSHIFKVLDVQIPPKVVFSPSV